LDRGSRPPERRTLQPGEQLFAEGEPGDLVGVVDDGEIDLVRRLASGGGAGRQGQSAASPGEGHRPAALVGDVP
jgi:CRP-like cAMP-binding protein